MGTRAAPPGDEPLVPALGQAWLTGAYDRVVRLTTRERTFKHALIAQAGIAAGDRILDVGCGTGTLAIWLKLAQPGADVRGVDGDPAVLARATAKAVAAGADIQFDQAQSQRLPYDDAQFDGVVSSLFFHHLSPAGKRETARELLRVLRPGGRLHVADWGRAANAVMRLLFVPVQLLDGFGNTQENVAGSLPEILRDAGFEDVVETRRFATSFGTLALYSARKPHHS